MDGQAPLLVSAAIASMMIGVSKRTFHYFRKREDFPKPIVLGPRAVRWRRHEIEAWVAGLETDSSPRPQPERLAKGKQRRVAVKTPFDL